MRTSVLLSKLSGSPTQWSCPGLLQYYLLHVTLFLEDLIPTAGGPVLVGPALLFTLTSYQLTFVFVPVVAGVCELQLLREVHLLQLLADAPPGPWLQPVRCQRLAHQVQGDQLPRLQETTAPLRPLPHEHGHACVQLSRYKETVYRKQGPVDIILLVTLW